jgi:hypothetical protein
MDRILKSARESGSLNLSNRSLRSISLSQIPIHSSWIPSNPTGCRARASTDYISSRGGIANGAFWIGNPLVANVMLTLLFHLRDIPKEVYNNLDTGSQDEKWWEVM